MSAPKSKVAKRRPKRLPVERICVQLRPGQLEALDAWIEKQDQPLTRSQALLRMIESRLKSAPTLSRSFFSKGQLRDALERVQAKTPLSDRLQTSKGDDYRDRLIEWTIKHSKSRNARELYNRLQVPEWIIWLNEAAGESQQRIQRAITEMKSAGSAQQRAAVVRKVLPWEEISQRLHTSRIA